MRRCALLALALVSSHVHAQLKTVGIEDAKKFESLGPVQVSNDGAWLLAATATTVGDPSETLKRIEGGTETRVALARGGAFSDDSRWVAWITGPGREEADRLRAERKPVVTGVTLRELSSGMERKFENVASFRFLKGGKTLLVQRTPGENGGDLMVVDLAKGRTLTLAGVVAAEPKSDGTALALVVRTGTEDALEILDPRTLGLRPVLFGKERLKGLVWSEKSDALALLRATPSEKKEGDTHTVVLVRGERIQTLEPTVTNAVPQGFRISESARLRVSDDGASVAFGVAPWTDKKAPLKPGELPKPEIWTYRDVRTVPVQRVRLAADRARTDVVVWRPEAGVSRRITTSPTESAVLVGDFSKVLLTDTKPYDSATTNGYGFADTNLVDVATGTKTRVVTKGHDPVFPSPKGRWLAYYANARWRLWDVAAAKPLDPLAESKTDFGNDLDDHAVPVPPPAAFPTWLDGEEGMIVSDRYDAWLVTPTKASRLTDGRKAHVGHSLVDPRTDRSEPLSAQGPFWFSSLDENTKATAYLRVDSTGKPLTLFGADASLGGLLKAKDADRLVYVRQTWADAPAVYRVGSPAAIFQTNPQRSQFAWGKAELVRYKSRWGLPLQGMLVYPASYQPGRKYPMVTYIYERLTQNLNAFQTPSESSSYSAQWLSQNGYFVLMPDIAYRRRSPGKDAVDCIEPALDAALARCPDIDPAKLGLMGHSWGGYQTAYVSSVSKRFAAAVAGAPLTDLVGMANTYYWNSGTPNDEILETSQGRMEVPFFEDPKAYLDNSPIWHAKERTTPLLMEFGDKDGAVDPHQPMAFYTTLRRMGKPVWMVMYKDENHNNALRPNQLDYAHRVRSFLDAFLKGTPMEPWMKDGVPLIDN